MRKGTIGPIIWVLLLVAAAGLLSQMAAGPANGPSKAISINNMKFDPADVEISVGQTVIWTNDDDRDHTVVARDGSFKSDNLRPGSSYSYQFTRMGRFAYSCSYHPRMKGTVSVSQK